MKLREKVEAGNRACDAHECESCPYVNEGCWQKLATDDYSLEKSKEMWISVKEQIPDNDRQVLAVKQLKDGTRQMTLAWCNLDHIHYDVETGNKVTEPYWVCGGNNNVIWWRDLPEMPEEEDK